MASSKDTSIRGYLGNDLSACLVLALLVLLLGLPWRWASLRVSDERQKGHEDRGLLRVEVMGDASLEGIYEVPPGTTVGALLETLGIEKEGQKGGDPEAWGRLLEDLCALNLVDRSRWQLGSMSPGKVFLLGEPMDLNRAGIWELTLLPGVGPVTARRIVSDRKVRGPFENPRDVSRVPGIPSRTLRRIMPLVTTNASSQGKGGS